MKTVAAVVAAVLFLGHQTGDAAPHCVRILQIGAWNIQWLGNPKAGKRAEQKPEDIAGYIKASGVEVLALSEISVTGKDAAGVPRNNLLDAAFDQLNASGASWKYVLLPKRQGARAPDDQWVGAAWNEQSVQEVGGPWRLEANIDLKREDTIRAKLKEPSPDTIIWSRWPYAIKFSAGKDLTDFVLVPIHLKSSTDGEVVGSEAREYEVKLLIEALVNAVPKIKDNDIVVLGDSNMLAATEPAGSAFAARGMKDCNSRDLGTHISFAAGAKNAPFDRVFVVSAEPETKDSCPSSGDGSQPLDFKIVRPSDWQVGMQQSEFRKRLSDHQMVRVGMCVMKDDD